MKLQKNSKLIVSFYPDYAEENVVNLTHGEFALSRPTLEKPSVNVHPLVVVIFFSQTPMCFFSVVLST